MRLRTSRRSILAAGLAAGALPLLPRLGGGGRPRDRRAGALLARHPARHGGGAGGGALCAGAGGGRGAARVDRLRPAQPDHLPQGRDALGGRLRGGQGALLPSGALLQGAGRDQRRGGGDGAGAFVLDRPLRHAGGASGAAARECRLRRVRGDGPGGEERLDGGARGVLLPHLGVLGAVRDVGARACDRLRAGRGRRSSRASPASGWKRRRRAGSSSTRSSRARGRPGPTGWRRRTTTGCSRTSRRRCSCAGRSTDWELRR